MRVVVVGGTGNISTGVVRALLQYGHEVTVYNRGLRPSRLPPGVRQLPGDRADRAAFEQTMQAESFHVAIDMICYTAEDAESDLRAFRDVGQLIHTSTVCTFGGPLPKVPADETTPLRPITAYGSNKKAADEVFLAAHARGELPVTIFKPAHTWGPGMIVIRQLGFDHGWLDRIRRGKPILITGDGENLWSFCHSDDIGIAYAAAVGRARCLGETYIATSPRYTTWREYHERVAAGLGYRVTLVEAPADLLLLVWPKITGLLASQARWNQCYCVAKLQRDLPEFQPRISLEDGIPANVAWMEEQGLLEDSRADDTEDRIIAGIDRLRADLGGTS
jgi:nucleoside-diphosphate-sugar epimerase